MRSRMIIAIFGLIGVLLMAQFALTAQTELPPPLVPEPEPTLDPFPRPNNIDIIVAEQVFEGGRMFYLDPVSRIWVMLNGEEDDTTGEWLIFADTWQEGEPESDSAIIAPDGLHQPIRGFGKIWRENPELREALGWGLDPEIGHETRYQFFEGEILETDAGLMQAPGFHVLNSFYGRTFFYDESQLTWGILDVAEAAEEEAVDEEAVEEAVEEDAAEMDEMAEEDMAEATEEPAADE